MDQLIRDGTVKRGYLGVQIKDLTDLDLAKRLGVAETGGVLVTQVFADAPGAKAGLKEGDVITSLAGKPVREGRQLQMTVAGQPLNKPVKMLIVRDGQAMTLDVVIEEQPADFGTRTSNAPRTPGSVGLDRVGLEVADLTPELAERLGFPAKSAGVAVVNVDDEGAAHQAGLRRGLLITKVDKQPVRSAAALRDTLDDAALERGVLLQVWTPQGGSAFVLLKVK
jgi:serine protease Do